MSGQVAETGGIALRRARGRRAGATAKSWRALQAAAVLLAGLGACWPAYHYSSSAYFANLTREPVNVRVHALQAEVECGSVVGRSAELLADRSLFGEPVTYRVEAGAALPLELADEYGQSSAGVCAVMIQLLGFPDQVVFWPSFGGATTESEFAEPSEPAFRQCSLVLEGHGDLKALARGSDLEVTPLPPLATGEQAFSAVPVLGWSGPVGLQGSFTLIRRETLPDGCTSLELVSEAEKISRLFLCAPEWSFPFEVGEQLSVLLEELAPKPVGYGEEATVALARHLQIEAGGEGPRLEIWLDAGKQQVPLVGAVTRLGPPGRRTACGAYADRLSVQLPLVEATLQAGDEAERTITDRHVRALLGRGDHLIVAPRDCPEGYRALGALFDLLILETPETPEVMP